ncbi:MAG TPA: hypothetical protein VGQ99_13250 [Tepidisphaeraceae bacterium]|jgi:hypothetical protein|nr:hypothetical protein [Tepidisphaeraceae bacterium]
MRISLLLAAAVLCSMMLGCGSLNKNQTPQQKAARINPHDPMMTTRYLTNRTLP